MVVTAPFFPLPAFSLMQDRVKLKSEGNRVLQVLKAQLGSLAGRVLYSSLCLPLPWTPQLQWRISCVSLHDGNTGNGGMRETSRVRI